MELVLRLVRDTYSREMGTFGTLSGYQGGEQWLQRNKMFEFETVERPWANNAPYVSCIPEGSYVLLQRTFYRAGYETLELQDVPDRSHILIHKGNTPADVQGCIALGDRRGTLENLWAVLGSGIAFDRFWKHIQSEAWKSMRIEICSALWIK